MSIASYISHIKYLEGILEERGISFTKQKQEEEIELNPLLSLNLTQDYIEDKLSKYYNERLFLKGINGITEFIFNYLVRDNEKNLLYLCENQRKKIFKYYNDKQEEEKDFRCKILLDTIQTPLLKSITNIYKKLVSNLENEDFIDEEERDELNNVIAKELLSPEMRDDKLNNVVSLFLNMKKCITIYRKPIIERLTDLLIQ